MKTEINNKTKTLLCVAMAGLFFIPGVLFNIWYLVLIGALFDWLPLPTGWMKANKRKKINKKFVFMHVISTLTAYLFAVLWFLTPHEIFKFLFLEIWWIAVILGLLIEK